MAGIVKMIEFVSLWRCKVDQDFYNTPFDERIKSPKFRTVHNGLGFDWELQVFPSGKTTSTGEEIRDHVSLNLRLEEGNLLSCTVAGYSLFLEVGGKQNNVNRRDARLFTHDEEGGWPCRGYPSFLNRKNIEQVKFEADYCRDGHITFGVHLKIRESEFDFERLWSKSRSQFPNGQPICDCPNSSQFRSFDQVFAREVAQPPGKKKQHAEFLAVSDKWSILNFQILTKDDHVIVCHKFVLVMNNEKFSTLIGSGGLAEAEKSSVEVDYSSKTMMEVLHNIYRGAPSTNLEGLVLNEVILAAEDYNLSELKLRCEQQLVQELTVQNSAEFLEQAHLYDLTVLKEVAINLITENTEVVRMSERGKESHIKDVIDLGNVLLCSGCLRFAYPEFSIYGQIFSDA